MLEESKAFASIGKVFIDTAKLTGEQMESALTWFADGGILTVKNYRIDKKLSTDSYCLERGNLIMSVGSVRQTHGRPSRGINGIMERWVDSIVDSAHKKAIEVQRTNGRTYFYEDGSLLAEVVKRFGEAKRVVNS